MVTMNNPSLLLININYSSKVLENYTLEFFKLHRKIMFWIQFKVLGIGMI